MVTTFLRRAAHHPASGLAAAIAVAAALQVVVALRSPVVSLDAYTFVQLARDLGSQPVAAMRSADQHPGFPALVLLAQGISEHAGGERGDRAWIRAGRWINGLSGLLSVVVVWKLTRRVFSTRVAHVAALVFAALPVFRENAVDAISDAPHLVLYVGALWLAAEGVARGSYPWFAAAGACSGLAFWIRPEGLSLVLVVSALLVCCAPWRRKCAPRRAWLSLAAIAGAALLVIGPYLLLSGKVTSKISTKLAVMRLVHAAPNAVNVIGYASPPNEVVPNEVVPNEVVPNEVVLNPAPAPLRLDHIPPKISSPGTALVAMAKGTRDAARGFSQCLRVVLLLPLAIGIWRASRVVDRPTRTLFWSLAMFHVLLVEGLYLIGGYVDRRHVMPLVGILMPLVGLGLCDIHAGLSRSGWFSKLGARAPAWSAALLFAVVGTCLVPRALRPLNESQLPVAEAIRWTQQHAAAGDRLLSNSRHFVLGTNAHGGATCETWEPLYSPRTREADRARFAAIQLEATEKLDWDERLQPDFAPVAWFRGRASLGQRDVVVYQRLAVARRKGNEETQRR